MNTTSVKPTPTAEWILVVEDDETLMRSIVRNLSARGYAARSARTVADATPMIGQECPRLILLDIDLPDGSGWEVLRGVRAGPCREITAVIVISALRPNMRLVNELGCFGVLEKPFPMEALLRQVGECVSPPEGPPVTA